MCEIHEAFHGTSFQNIIRNFQIKNTSVRQTGIIFTAVQYYMSKRLYRLPPLQIDGSYIIPSMLLFNLLGLDVCCSA